MPNNAPYKPLSLSEAERKLVVMDSFSDVVYLLKIPDFFAAHGSNVLSRSGVASKMPSSDCEVKINRNIICQTLLNIHLITMPCVHEYPNYKFNLHTTNKIKYSKA